MKTFFEIFNEIIGSVPYGEGSGGIPKLFIKLRPLYNLPATIENLNFIFLYEGTYLLSEANKDFSIDKFLNLLDLNTRKLLTLTPEAIERFQIQFPESLYLKAK